MNLVEALSREIQRIAVLNEQFGCVSRGFNRLEALLEEAHVAMGEGEITGLARALDRMRAIGSKEPSSIMMDPKGKQDKFVQLIKLECRDCGQNLVEKPATILYGTGVIMYCKTAACNHKRYFFEIDDLTEGEHYIKL